LISLSGTGDLSSESTWNGLAVNQPRTNSPEVESYAFNEDTGRLVFGNDTVDGGIVISLSEETFTGGDSGTFVESGTTITETFSEVGTWLEVN
jgi:hypothetical protein